MPDPRDTTPAPLAAAVPAAGTEPARPRVIDAAALFGDGKVVHITHAGETWVLRLTRQNKLILTK